MTIPQVLQMSEYTGENLYLRLLSGEQEAMDGLVDLYGDGLMLFLRQMVDSAQDAEELTVDAFARLAAGSFRSRESLKAHLYTIARNLALAHQKEHRREGPPSRDEAPSGAGWYADALPETPFWQEERNRRIFAALQALKPEYRITLYLLHFEGMRPAEAGRVLERSERQMGELACRAQAALKTRLESEGDAHEEP